MEKSATIVRSSSILQNCVVLVTDVPMLSMKTIESANHWPSTRREHIGEQYKGAGDRNRSLRQAGKVQVGPRS